MTPTAFFPFLQSLSLPFSKEQKIIYFLFNLKQEQKEAEMKVPTWRL